MSSRLYRAGLALFATLALIGGSIVSVSASATPAQALVTSGFQAGNIIDDSLFYDGSAMTTSQVQAFLKKQVPTCTIGSVSYKKPGSTAQTSSPVASKCLRDFTQTTSSKAADAYCKSYAGAKNETAAAIIAKVSKACGISSKVLLVMLEKEQSLVTDSWPTVRMYNYAMGWGCPDSGPGNSANCDSNGAGFWYQVYKSAWQFKVYKTSNNFNFKSGKSSAVQYHPSTSCGTSNFKMQNAATAALYNYTPYRPNSAALSAGWGTGNSCSSYGNRNFYNFYTSWFGSVHSSISVTGTIKTYYNAAGRAAEFGAPLSARKKITQNGGGYQQVFANGVITYSAKLKKTFGVTNTHSTDKWATAYLNAGGAAGKWGFITSEGTRTSYGTLTLQNGTAISNAVVGVRFMPAPIYKKWVAAGGRNSEYGWPNSNALFPTSTSANQRFENGTLMVTGSYSTFLTASETAAWNALGGYNKVGYYKTNPVVVGAKSYRTTTKGMAFFLSSSKRIFVANGNILSRYKTSGGPKSKWGFPTAAVKARGKTGTQLQLENGVIVSSTTGGTRVLTTAAFNNWIKRGGPSGRLGYPNQNTVTVTSSKYGNGSYQRFARYIVFYGPKQTRLLARDKIVNAYISKGGPTKSGWGWPTGVKKKGKNGNFTIVFSNGTASYNKKSNKVTFKKKAVKPSSASATQAPITPATPNPTLEPLAEPTTTPSNEPEESVAPEAETEGSAAQDGADTDDATTGEARVEGE